jgi:hypothetical protein
MMGVAGQDFQRDELAKLSITCEPDLAIAATTETALEHESMI